jgi:hypothetical protein
MWREDAGEIGPEEWRGEVRYLPGATVRYVRGWDGIPETMQALMGEDET